MLSSEPKQLISWKRKNRVQKLSNWKKCPNSYDNINCQTIGVLLKSKQTNLMKIRITTEKNIQTLSVWWNFYLFEFSWYLISYLNKLLILILSRKESTAYRDLRVARPTRPFHVVWGNDVHLRSYRQGLLWSLPPRC